MSDPLAPYFLGAYGENNEQLERVLLEFLRDHVYWRRNFHPEDRPPIDTRDQYSPEFLEGLSRSKQELHQLTAALKKSVPFFHPRYIGHMVSDLLLPGLIAQLVTTLYNPNNVVEDAAPVTVALELEVGRQLATMLGFSVDPKATPCALGHLTSGGTVANYESLWLARAVKLLPLAVKDAAVAAGRAVLLGETDVRTLDDWALLNVDPQRTLTLARALGAFATDVEAHREESLGMAAFARRHPLVERLTVFVPETAHYSWAKAMKLLGLGTSQLSQVPTREARLDAEALRGLLARAIGERTPVLAVVGVYGTTEFGTLDPLHEIAALRESLRPRGLDFWFHVDAAWGGYLPSLFRAPTGELRPREDVGREFRYFPSERVYRATEAIACADSVTVDPHKLGFTPYGAGAFVARDRRAFDLVVQGAAYVFHGTEPDDHTRYRNVGRFILEGSKPGAAAAACAVNHRVLPLDAPHFGRVMARLVQHAEELWDTLRQHAQDSGVHVCLPVEPDCNVVCLSLNLPGNRSLKAANALTQRVFEAFKVEPKAPVQTRNFFASCTTVPLAHLGPGELERVGRELDVDVTHPDDQSLFLLRHTLMNPWLRSAPRGGTETYLDLYCRELLELTRSLR